VFSGLASAKGGIVIKNPFFMANGVQGEGLPPPLEAVKAHLPNNNNNNGTTSNSSNSSRGNNHFNNGGPKGLAAFNWKWKKGEKRIIVKKALKVCFKFEDLKQQKAKKSQKKDFG
jgi:hypothetical protein